MSSLRIASATVVILALIIIAIFVYVQANTINGSGILPCQLEQVQKDFNLKPC